MDRHAGDLFRSELCAYPELLRLKDDANRLLEKWQMNFRLSAIDFVIWMHGGYMFCYFDTASGAADPPVYICRDRFPEPVKLSDSFTDWMRSSLRIVLRSGVDSLVWFRLYKLSTALPVPEIAVNCAFLYGLVAAPLTKVIRSSSLRSELP